MKDVVESWQVLAKARGSVHELIIRGIFPWCFTSEFYVEKSEMNGRKSSISGVWSSCGATRESKHPGTHPAINHEYTCSR